MILTGTHTCEKCNTANEWAYIVPQKLSDSNGILQTDTIPNGKIQLGKRNRLSDAEYEMCYRCPKCDHLNIFKLTSDKYL